MCRRVFDPFEVQLRISKSAATAHTNSPEKGRTPAGSPMPQPSQGQEIRLIIPQIGAIMDSKEFEVLTDVISHVGMAEVTAHSSLLFVVLVVFPQPFTQLTFAYLA